MGRRLAARQEHLELGDGMKADGRLLYALALLDEGGTMRGSVMVVDFPSRKALDEWLKVEPYVTQKVWREIEIRACKVGPSFLAGNTRLNIVSK